ncbi:sarcosine oxidase subunit gamma family protein [Labrenzia sp. DG1229]|uniref:sarcosine oxidase subunit gamma n=1 Tax=Labrenzia sp. DG1229 TaxID=681847 RepID=UPI00048E7DCC|nr:sarcosine oxidase subunit gamma family protein [Labrenzia sp. DG1229]
MPEYRLSPAPALGPGAADRIEVGSYGIEENISIAIASVASRSCRSKDVRAVLRQILKCDAPEAGAFVVGGGYRAFWTGPDQWMMLAEHENHELLASELKERLGETASVTEQNDGWVCLDVTGDNLPVVFERLTVADVWKLESGSAVRTVIEHIGCFLICVEQDRHYRLLAGRSFAKSFHHAILTALRSTQLLYPDSK